MALFKIEKGVSSNLAKNRPNTVEGYCYVTTDDGKMYIDIKTGGQANNSEYRMVLNAGHADTATLADKATTADTVDKLKTARKITLSGDVSGEALFDGSQDITITSDLATTGVTKGFYGLSADAEGSNGTEIAIPYLNIDSDGRILNAYNKKYKAINTDTLVKQTVTTSNLNYPLLLAKNGLTATTNGGEAYFDSGVTLNPSTNTIAADISGNAATATAATTATKLKKARALKIGSTSKNFDGSAGVTWTHAEIGASVSNKWTAGTTAGPTLSTTVNGVAGTAVAIPVASISHSGVVTTSAQRFRGAKTLEYPVMSSNNTQWQGYLYANNAGTKVGEHWLDCGDTTNISTTRFWWRQYSPNSTANTATTGYYEQYSLPSCKAGRTSNASYEIFTSKSYSTLDGRYLKLSGGTINADKQIVRAGSSASWYNGRDHAIIRQNSYTGYNPIISVKTTNGSWELGPYTSNTLYFVYNTDTGYNSGTNTSGQYFNSVKLNPNGTIYGAVWNDYAEYRICKEEFKPGQVVYENGDDTMSISNNRLQRGCSIVSDTFGFAIGETNEAKCPIAVSGRVLAYGYESREEFKKHIGWPVCSGPNGTVSIMTEEEEEKYPSRIIGIISAVPDYEEWGTENTKVNGRIWIKVK